MQVQTTRTFQLNLGVLDGTPQRLAQMPLARAYQGVYHLSFKGEPLERSCSNSLLRLPLLSCVVLLRVALL
jgi:hypothetical protein